MPYRLEEDFTQPLEKLLREETMKPMTPETEKRGEKVPLKWCVRRRKARYSTPDEGAFKEALVMIRDIAFKHEVQYWKDEPGADAERLARILTIARSYLNGLEIDKSFPSRERGER